jgi:hypothetical protein
MSHSRLISVRATVLLADEFGIHTPIPVHWELFVANSVSPEQIRPIYHREKLGFNL